MNKKYSLKDLLLPGREELIPINPNNTFGECGYNEGTFKDLSIEKQLKLAKDIVRQAIEINYFPTPGDEMRLSGDCVTTAKIYIEYAHKLKIPGEFRLASVCRNPFDFEGRRSTRHVIVLHKNPGTNLYQIIDPAVMVGYGYGTVSGPAYFNGKKLINTGSEKLCYEDIRELKEEDLTAIGIINYARNLWHVQNTYSPPLGERFLDQVKEIVANRNYMDSWVSELYYIQAMAYLAVGDDLKFKRNIRKSVQLNPLKPKILDHEQAPKDVQKIVASTFRMYQEIARTKSVEWREQARELLTNDNPQNYPKAIELMQWAYREIQGARLINKDIPFISVNHQKVAFYNINPRFLHEHGLTTAWIKPTAYCLDIQSSAKSAITATGEIIWEKQINLTMSNRYGYKPIFATHPHGKANMRYYSGPSLVCLIKATAAEVSAAKRKFRINAEKRLKNKTLSWFDGKSIEWNPWTMNYIHSADSAAESVVHLLMTHPELSLINRWVYPHPNL